MLLIIAFYTFYRRAGADADCRQAHSGRPRRRQMGRGPTPLVVGAEDAAPRTRTPCAATGTHP